MPAEPSPWWHCWLAGIASTAVPTILFWRQLGSLHLAAAAGLWCLVPPALVLAQRYLRCWWPNGRNAETRDATRSRTPGVETVGNGADARHPLVHRIPGWRLGLVWSGSIRTFCDAARRYVLCRGMFLPTLFLVAWVKFWAVGENSSQFVPALHDEWSYLFAAETLARGRFANDPPPRPEFFDAFHILTTPRWVSRYPPGHPAALAVGCLVGWPAVIPVTLGAAFVALIYRAASVGGDELSGRLAALLALIAPGSDLVATCFLSQSTFVVTMTASLLASIKAGRRTSPPWSLVAGLFGGWAILTRPFPAVAMGVPLAGWLVWKMVHNRAATIRIRLLVLIAGAAPIVGSAVLWAYYNLATTGRATTTAWQEYNRQYEPDNTVGFGGGIPALVPTSLDARKAQKAIGIANEKRTFTLVVALRRAFVESDRLLAIVMPATGFVAIAAFVPLAVLRRRDRLADVRESTAASSTAPDFAPAHESQRLSPNRESGISMALLLSMAAGHYLAYSCFYSTWGAYGLELLPISVLLAGVGAAETWRWMAASRNHVMTAVVPIVFGAAVAFCAAIHLPRFAATRQAETAFHRALDAQLRRLGPDPAVLFVQLDPTSRHPYDPIHNAPGLDSAIVIALDRGRESNLELMRGHFTNRRGYVWDEANGRIEPLR